jgi:hypothetical protein
MEPGQAIDGAARLLSELFKKTGDWKESVKQYKGVATDSPENTAMVEGAFNKAGKYVRSEPERQVLQQAAGSGSDPTMQMLLEVMKAIAGHTESTSKNTAYQPPGARAPRIGPS